MAFTHTSSIGWTNGSRSIVTTKQYTGGAQQSINEAVNDSVTDLEMIIAIDVSAIKHIYIKADVDMTLETNDGTTPTDTINLKANVPYIFNADIDAYFTNLLTADVTSIFMTNASGTDGTLELEVLTDPTP